MVSHPLVSVSASPSTCLSCACKRFVLPGSHKEPQDRAGDGPARECQQPDPSSCDSLSLLTELEISGPDDSQKKNIVEKTEEPRTTSKIQTP